MKTQKSGFLPRYERCFICGDRKANPCSMSIRFYWDGEKIDTIVRPEDYYMGFDRIVHGGIQTAIMDEAMGWAAVCARGRMAYSGEITIRFNRPLPPGTEVKVKAWLEEDRKRLLIARGQIEDGDGNIYARGRGKYFPIDEEAHRRVMELLYVEGQEDRPVTEDDF